MVPLGQLGGLVPPDKSEAQRETRVAQELQDRLR